MKINPKELFEAAGVVSIVASLIFVGLQLRLETRLATAEIYSQRTEQRLGALQTLLESEVALRELVAARENPQSTFRIPSAWTVEGDPILTEARRIRNEMNFVLFDNIFYQNSLGLIEDVSASHNTFQRLFSDDEVLDFLLTNTGLISQETVAFIQSLRNQ